MYVNEMDPYEEAQHIIEVLSRGNPLKGVSHKGGIIQVEQKTKEGLEIVLQELRRKGYSIISIQHSYTSWAVGIAKINKKEQEPEDETPGFEPGD